MLVIHGIWARDALCLWAEDSALQASWRRGPGSHLQGPRPHPFAADPGVLGDALGLLGEGPGTSPARPPRTNSPFSLPSGDQGPGSARG